jgi:hypothetical protein
MGRAFNLGRVPKVRSVDIFMLKSEPPPDKHEKLKANEHAVFLTGVVLISATGGSRDKMRHV